MYVLISVDIEGVSGVVSDEAVTSTHRDYERFRRLMTAEANAAVDGALAGGATRVVVNDSHGPMTNIIIEDLNAAAELTSGTPRPFSMMQGIGPAVDAVFLVGYHAASGTESAVLEHTYSGRSVFEVRLNDRPLGELGFNAALAGFYGVPVKLVTGDRATTEEARSLLGTVETVAVKDGLARKAAHCLSPKIAQARIREAASRAAGLQVAPLIFSAPYTVSVTFMRASQADAASFIPYSRRHGRTVEWTGDDLPTVFRTLIAMIDLASTS